MAGNKHFRAIEQQLEKFGYEPLTCNTKGMWIYSHPEFGEVSVSTSPSEDGARVLLKMLQKRHGAFVPKPKRDALAIKERQSHDREALKAQAARLDIERAKLNAERDRHLGGLGAKLSMAEMRDLIHRLEEIDREQHAIQKLMNAPVGNSHLGTDQVRHQAGSR